MLSKIFPNVASLDVDFKKWLLIGVALEIIIFGYSYFLFPGEPNDIFRHAARYSGRLSLFIYLFAFSYFALTFYSDEPDLMSTLKKIVSIFCVLHFIHF
ncbi:MAG: hypothetical protein AB8H12_00650, partial [Lewinella sp.]